MGTQENDNKWKIKQQMKRRQIGFEILKSALSYTTGSHIFSSRMENFSPSVLSQIVIAFGSFLLMDFVNWIPLHCKKTKYLNVGVNC